MKQNLWIYADGDRQRDVAESLIGLGIDVFKRARIIKQFDYLQNYVKARKEGKPYRQSPIIVEYVLEYVVDIIRILIFFENYMKAELILKDYCVHEIDHNIPEFTSLATDQRKRPIGLGEIQKIEPYKYELDKNEIYHRAVKMTTIGMNTLINKPAYFEHYKFDNEVLEIVREFNKVRNQLHFRESAEMNMSQDWLDKIMKLDEFVNSLLANQAMR